MRGRLKSLFPLPKSPCTQDRWLTSPTQNDLAFVLTTSDPFFAHNPILLIPPIPQTTLRSIHATLLRHVPQFVAHCGVVMAQEPYYAEAAQRGNLNETGDPTPQKLPVTQLQRVTWRSWGMDSSDNQSFYSPKAIPELGSRTQTPVLTLDHDILLNIFKLNSNLLLKQEGCLNSLRQYSQVCRDWRDLLLSTTWIWGRAFSLLDLRPASDSWKAEIVRRSGDSFLWIKGSLIHFSMSHYHSMSKFLKGLFDTHWEKIQRFDIVVSQRSLADMTQWRHSSFSRAAPNLVSFKIETDYGNKGYFPHCPFETPPVHFFASSTGLPSLFGGSAPCLSEFNANPAIPFTLDGPWLSNIRVLHIGFQVCMEDILNTIRNTPRVERIIVESQADFSSATTFHLPKFRLPATKRFYFEGHLRTLLDILKYVELPHDCRVSITIAAMDRMHASDSVLSPLNSLAQLLQGYFATRNSKSMYVLCRYPVQLLVSDTSRGRHQDLLLVHIRDRISRDVEAEAICDYILNSCQSPLSVFTCIEDLELDIATDFSSTTPWSFQSQAALLRSFSSVNSLHTDEETLRNISAILSSLRSQDDALLPSLKQIAWSSRYSGGDGFLYSPWGTEERVLDTDTFGQVVNQVLEAVRMKLISP